MLSLTRGSNAFAFSFALALAPAPASPRKTMRVEIESARDQCRWLRNFQQVYRARVDEWQWIDNSGMTPRLLEEGSRK